MERDLVALCVHALLPLMLLTHSLVRVCIHPLDLFTCSSCQSAEVLLLLRVGLWNSRAGPQKQNSKVESVSYLIRLDEVLGKLVMTTQHLHAYANKKLVMTS